MTDETIKSISNETGAALGGEPEKVSVGGKEYSSQELESLVGLGQIAKEVETSQNTKIGNLYPEFTRSRQELKSVREELEALKAQAEQRTKLPENEEQAIKEARDAAKKLGLVSVDDFKEVLGKHYRDFYVQERAAEKLLDDVMGLQGEVDGSDGRPAFVAEDILEYMRDTGVKSPKAAYSLKFEGELLKWKEQQLTKAKKPGMATMETMPGVKQPAEVKITKDNIHQLVSEALNE